MKTRKSQKFCIQKSERGGAQLTRVQQSVQLPAINEKFVRDADHKNYMLRLECIEDIYNFSKVLNWKNIIMF